jgi:hypothetical protein
VRCRFEAMLDQLRGFCINVPRQISVVGYDDGGEKKQLMIGKLEVKVLERKVRCGHLNSRWYSSFC